MEWQLNGSDTQPAHIKDPKPTEEEEIERELEQEDDEPKLGDRGSGDSIETPSTPSSPSR